MNGYEDPKIIEANIVEAVKALIDSDPAEMQRELRPLVIDLAAASNYWYGP